MRLISENRSLGLRQVNFFVFLRANRSRAQGVLAEIGFGEVNVDETIEIWKLATESATHTSIEVSAGLRMHDYPCIVPRQQFAFGCALREKFPEILEGWVDRRVEREAPRVSSLRPLILIAHRTRREIEKEKLHTRDVGAACVIRRHLVW